MIRPESVELAVAAVEPLEFRSRALPMTFKDGMSLQRVSKISKGALLTLDLLLVNASLEPIWASRQRFDVEGRVVWVISRDVARSRPRSPSRARRERFAAGTPATDVCTQNRSYGYPGGMNIRPINDLVLDPQG